MDQDFKIFIWLILSLLFLLIFFNNFRKKPLNMQSYNFIISKKNRIIKAVFFIFAITFLFLAYFGIDFMNLNSNINSKSSNIVFVLDVSKSMDIIDVNYRKKLYSRLDYSKELIKSYVGTNSENNYSLIVFAWDTLVISPLTQDLDIFLTFLDSINTSSIQASWSNFNKMLNTILNISNKQEINIVIISDWWDNEDKIDKNLYFPKDKSQKFFTIWVWSYKWDKIPLWQDIFWNILYKQFNGEYIVEWLNESNLKSIADLTKGEYISTESSINNLSKINNNLINSWTKLVKDSVENNRRINILFSFILSLIWYLIPYRYEKWKK